jgi:ParB family chromosome partitioning protein
MQIESTDLWPVRQDDTVSLPITAIQPCRFHIRKELGNLEELKRSISEVGLLHPIVVRTLDSSTYEVVAGNRRFQAFKELGMASIPCIIRDLTDRAAFELMITENVQRETLTPLEEARAFYAYVGPKNRKCYGYGRISELAKKIGKSQEYVSNRMRLLRLPEALLRELFSQNQFRVSQAEELASLANNPKVVEELKQRLLNKKISVRELERAIRFIKAGVDVDRAVELAKTELELKVDWNYQIPLKDDDSMKILMKRCELVLRSALTYVDNVAESLEKDPVLHQRWIAEVRVRVHDAITGIISCRKSSNLSR